MASRENSNPVSQDVQEMSYMKTSTADAETPRQYCPHPLTSGQFPQPSQPEYHALLSRSQGDDATRLNNVDAPIETSRNSTETGHFYGNSNPSRPYTNDFSANRYMPGPFPVENSDVRMVPTERPPAYTTAPAYNQMITPRGTNTPRIVAAGTYLNTNPNSWAVGTPLNTRPTIIRGNVQNPNRTWRKVWITFLVIILAIALLVATAFVRLMNERRIRDDIVKTLRN